MPRSHRGLWTQCKASGSIILYITLSSSQDLSGYADAPPAAGRPPCRLPLNSLLAQSRVGPAMWPLFTNMILLAATTPPVLFSSNRFPLSAPTADSFPTTLARLHMHLLTWCSQLFRVSRATHPVRFWRHDGLRDRFSVGNWLCLMSTSL